MDIFNKVHKFMKRGRIHKVVKMVTKENENVRKKQRNRHRATKGNA